jgi:hypothetical protein
MIRTANGFELSGAVKSPNLSSRNLKHNTNPIFSSPRRPLQRFVMPLSFAQKITNARDKSNPWVALSIEEGDFTRLIAIHNGDIPLLGRADDA